MNRDSLNEHKNGFLLSLRQSTPLRQYRAQMGAPVGLRSGLRQCGVGLILRLPRAYPSARKRASERAWANFCRAYGAGLWPGMALRSFRSHFQREHAKGATQTRCDPLLIHSADWVEKRVDRRGSVGMNGDGAIPWGVGRKSAESAGRGTEIAVIGKGKDNSI